MSNAFVIPLDAAESRVAEAMMGLVDDEAQQQLGHCSREWSVHVGDGSYDLGSQISAAMVPRVLRRRRLSTWSTGWLPSHAAQFGTLGAFSVSERR